MHKLYEYICDELHEIEEKAMRGKVPMDEMKYGDMLAHFGKNLDKMMEAEGEYSEAYPMSYRGSYDGSYDGSYARGRGRNARRDAMGRYSRDGYSRNYDDGYSGRRGYSRDDARQDYMNRIRDLAENAPDEETRMRMERMMQSI